MTKIYTNNEPAPKLDTIKQTVLKRRKSAKMDVIRLQREKAKNIRIQARKYSASIKGPAAFIIEAKKNRFTKKRIDNLKKQGAPEFLPENPKLGVVIRLGGFNGLSEKMENLFKKLRLDTYNQAVFVKVDRRMLKKLLILKPYIAWGYPSVEIVNDLLAKRGWANIDSKRVRIGGNAIIEDHLGSHDIICLADIVHELVNVGENFDAVNAFLWPFKLLSAPPRALGKGNERRNQAREPGHRDIHINELLQRMI